MRLTVSTIAASLARHLSPVLPGVTFYEDPNQQGTRTPCLFLQQRFSRLKKETGGFWVQRIGLDLVYLERTALPDLSRRYLRAAQALDEVLELIPYSDGEGANTVLLRTQEREWRIKPDALHYRFELAERVNAPGQEEKMQVMDLREAIE